MSNTPSNIVSNARQTTTKVLSVSRESKKDLNAIVFVVRCKAHTEKVYYDVTVEFYPTQVHKDTFKKPSLDNPSWVKCSCPFFLFHCEYALAKAGSSEIDYSNGKPPVVTNPKMIPYLCKHLYAGSNEAVQRADRIAIPDAKTKFV